MEAQRITLTLRINPNYPTEANPRRRFEKLLSERPWSQSVVAFVELDDPAWELLGHPSQLVVSISS